MAKRPREEAEPSRAHSGSDSNASPQRSPPLPRLPPGFPSNIHHIIPERGIDLSQFRGLIVNNQITALNWNEYVTSHMHYSPSLVREFYDCMDPVTFASTGVVTMQGCRVRFSAERINQHFGLRSLPLTSSRQGMPHHPWNIGSRTPALADYLRTSPTGLWSSINGLTRDQLCIQAAFWSIFLMHSIYPAPPHSSLTPAMAFAIYCILHRLPIDVGSIILREMVRPAREPHSSLFFPRLISQFCCQDGVMVLDGDDMELLPPPIGLADYHAIMHERQALPPVDAPIPIVAPVSASSAFRSTPPPAPIQESPVIEEIRDHLMMLLSAVQEVRHQLEQLTSRVDRMEETLASFCDRPQR